MDDKKISHKPQPIDLRHKGLNIKPTGKKPRRTWIAVGLIAVIALALAVLGTVTWFYLQLLPVGGQAQNMLKITVDRGSTSSQIAKQLEEKKVIRNAFAFETYVRLSGKGSKLQAGTYRLSPSESVSQIVEHFVQGKVAQFKITFYPGATLVDKTNKPENSKQDVTTVLKRAGYSDEEIKDGLDSVFSGELFAGKPLDSDLEGYVYGDTYYVNDGATVADILQSTFDKFYKDIKDNNLQAGFAKHGLNLYQAITLASIVQREARAKDMPQVAQVFYRRLEIGMTLGSDVTYQYIADKLGLERDYNLDSKYNTRRYGGLPPGPIASPGLAALKAVASPASGDYLYFLSGDDGVMYFAKTDAEHQANITKHCQIGCSTQ